MCSESVACHYPKQLYPCNNAGKTSLDCEEGIICSCILLSGLFSGDEVSISAHFHVTESLLLPRDHVVSLDDVPSISR